jgi:hypothetical protein
MRRICSWCQKDMGEAPDDDTDFDTHGICEECNVEQEKDFEKAKQELEDAKKAENPEFKIR